eukprot:m.656456 g.656456  ORF g.656456 m.656456 type:complete len:789 (+) comp22703_c0_seq2:165-2531(+)
MMEAEELDDVVPTGETTTTPAEEKLQKPASEASAADSTQSDSTSLPSCAEPVDLSHINQCIDQASTTPGTSPDRPHDVTSPQQVFDSEQVMTGDSPIGTNSHVPSSPHDTSYTHALPSQLPEDPRASANPPDANFSPSGPTMTQMTSSGTGTQINVLTPTASANEDLAVVDNVGEKTSYARADDDDFAQLAALADVEVEQVKQQPYAPSNTFASSPQRQGDFADVPLSPSDDGTNNEQSRIEQPGSPIAAPATPTVQPPPMTQYSSPPPPQSPMHGSQPATTVAPPAPGGMHWCEANSISGDNKDPGYYNRGWNDPLAVMQSGYSAPTANRKAPSRRRYNYALASVTTGVGATGGVAAPHPPTQQQPPMGQYGQPLPNATMQPVGGPPPPQQFATAEPTHAPPPPQQFADVEHPAAPHPVDGQPVTTITATPSTVDAAVVPSTTVSPPPPTTAPPTTVSAGAAEAPGIGIASGDGGDAGAMGGFKMVELAPVLTMTQGTTKQPLSQTAPTPAGGSGRHDPPVAYTSSFEPPSFASAAASKDLCDMLLAFVAEKVDRAKMNRRAGEDMDTRLRVLCDALTSNKLMGPAREQVADMIGALCDERFDSVRQHLAVLVERFPMDAEGWIVGIKRILHEVDPSTVVQAPHSHHQPAPQTPTQPLMMQQQQREVQPPALMPIPVGAGQQQPATFPVPGYPQQQQPPPQTYHGHQNYPDPTQSAGGGVGGAPTVQAYDMGGAGAYSYPSMPTHQEQQQRNYDTGVGGTLDRLHSWASSWLAPPSAKDTLASIAPQ